MKIIISPTIFHIHHGSRALFVRYFNIFVPGITCQTDDIPGKRENNLTHIESYLADYVIDTGGSASEKTRNGVASTNFPRGIPLQPEVLATIKTNGRSFPSSYDQ